MGFWTDIYYVFKREFYAVFRDHAVLTFFVALMLGYPVVYTFIYSNEVAREVPVAVVDHSKSALSLSGIGMPRRVWTWWPVVRIWRRRSC